MAPIFQLAVAGAIFGYVTNYLRISKFIYNKFCIIYSYKIMKKQCHNVCLHFQGHIEIINIIKILLKSS